MSDIDWFGEATGINKITAQPVMDAAPPAAGASGMPKSIDWFSETTGLDKIKPPTAQAASPDSTQGWGDWVRTSIQGKHDPRYKDLPTVFSQFSDELRSPTATAAVGGASDEAMGDIVQKNLGDRFLRRFKDSNGYDIFVTRGPDGKPQGGYLNKPGLDSEDAWRTIYGAAPYVVGGAGIKALSKGLGAGTEMLMQAAGAGATSAAGDVATGMQGSEQGIDFEKAGVMAAAGGLAVPIERGVSALYRNLVTIPGLIDRSTGQLTEKGMAAVREAGIDPSDVTPNFASNFAKSFAANGDAAQAATRAGLDEYGIPATRGQISKDPYLLTQEEGMRRRLYGESAQDTMLGFDKQQQDAMRFAALGDDGAGTVLPEQGVRQQRLSPFRPKQGIGEQINPGRQPGALDADRMPGTLGSNVQSSLRSARATAKSQEASLWDDSVRDLGATDTALANLRPHMESALANETAFTPTGQRMAQEIGQFAEGKLPVEEAGGIKLKQVQSVDQMRRRLKGIMDSAPDGSDKQQAGQIYGAFNDWISDSAQKRLLLGEPAAAMQLVKARGFTKEVRQIFEPRSADGTMSPGGRRIAAIMDTSKADSGEGVIQSLFGSDGSLSAGKGTISALTNIKAALDRFGAQADATQAWNDIRLAYWSRLVTGKNGELLGATAMMNNVKSAMQGQNTLMKTLFSPDELRQMRLFQNALSQVSYKPPNASGSGYTAASFIKDGLLKILDTFNIGTPARAALERTGVVNAWNTAAAKQAIRQVPKPTPAPLSPAITAGASPYANGFTSGPPNNALMYTGGNALEGANVFSR